jgi:hypothetical protein
MCTVKQAISPLGITGEPLLPLKRKAETWNCIAEITASAGPCIEQYAPSGEPTNKIEKNARATGSIVREEDGLLKAARGTCGTGGSNVQSV